LGPHRLQPCRGLGRADQRWWWRPAARRPFPRVGTPAGTAAPAWCHQAMTPDGRSGPGQLWDARTSRWAGEAREMSPDTPCMLVESECAAPPTPALVGSKRPSSSTTVPSGRSPIRVWYNRPSVALSCIQVRYVSVGLSAEVNETGPMGAWRLTTQQVPAPLASGMRPTRRVPSAFFPALKVCP
jgi:hypothetical protein